MGETHEIVKLNFQIEGHLEAEQEYTIREVIKEVIERYFDLFDNPQRTITIEKIHFDLGSIRADNLKEELIVRLSYLLKTELQKFFNQPDIDNLLIQKEIVSRTDAFITYLQQGWTKNENIDLAGLFQHFLETNISLLKEIMLKAGQSPQVRKRLFYQIKYETLVLYWKKAYPQKFRQVDAIIQKIRNDTGQKQTYNQREESLVAILNMLAFDFMMDQSEVDQGNKFIEILKHQVDRFKPFEHLFTTSSFLYLDKLSGEFEKTSGQTFLKRQLYDENLEGLAHYIQTGKTSKRNFANLLFSKALQLDKTEIEKLAKTLVFESDLKIVHLERTWKALGNQNFEMLLNTIRASVNGSLKDRIEEIDYFRSVVKKLFHEDIFRLSPQAWFIYLSQKSSSIGFLQKSIAQYLELISAKTRMHKKDIIIRLSSHLESTAHRQSRALKHILKQQRDELKEPKKISLAKDAMSAYLHFIKSGVWMFESATPQEVLVHLLEDSPEHLAMALSKLIRNQTVWLRIVYQHPVEVVIKVFDAVFIHDEHLAHLHNQLKNIKTIEFKELYQRRYLEAFVTAKALFISDTTFPFEVIFEKALYDLQGEAKSMLSEAGMDFDEDIQLILTLYLKGTSNEILTNPNQKKYVLETLLAHPHHLMRHITDSAITESKWKQFLLLFEKPELVQLLKITLKINTFSHPIIKAIFNELSDNEVLKLMSKNKLVQLVLSLLTQSFAKLESFISSNINIWASKEGKILKAILPTFILPSSNELFNLDFDVNETAIDKIELKGVLQKLTIYLKKLALTDYVSSIQLKGLILDSIPLSQTAEELEQILLTKLAFEYPQVAPQIEKLTNITLAEKGEEQGFSAIVVALVDGSSYNPKPYFESFEVFEQYLIKVLKNTDQLFKSFSNLPPKKLINFLNQLKDSTLQLFQKYLETKFAQTQYSKIYEQVITSEKNLAQKIKISTITYGVTQVSFNIPSYLAFLNSTIEEFQTQEILSFQDQKVASEQIKSTLYVEAFIHYLEFGKYIYVEIEQDGIEEALNKILTYWPDILLLQLSNSTSILKIMENLFLQIQESQLTRIFSQLFQYQNSQVDAVLNVLIKKSKTTNVQLFSHWAELLLTSQSEIKPYQFIDYWLAKSSVEFDKSLSKELKPNQISNDLLAQIPDTFLDNILFSSQAKKNTIKDFLEEVLASGKWPLLIRKGQYQNVKVWLLEMAKQVPEHINEVLNHSIKSFKEMQHLHKVLGHMVLMDMFKALEASHYSVLVREIKKLVKIHQQLGNKEALYDYFLIRYLAIFYTISDSSPQIIVVDILSRVTQDFGISTTDYRELLSKSNDKSIQLFLDQSNHNKEIDIDSGPVFQIDLLIHLILEEKVPWWAASVYAEHRSTKDHIVDLVKNIFEKSPTHLINTINQRKEATRIYRKMLPYISNQQLEQALLILAPDFGGFMISVNLLVLRSKLTVDRSQWYSFLLGIAVEASNLKVSWFLPRALAALAKLSQKKVEVISVKMLDSAKEAIKNGEMRFLPFIELLGNQQMEANQDTFIKDNLRTYKSYNFIDIVVYYVKIGSLPTQILPEIKNYDQFIKLINRHIQFGHNELRLAIRKVLIEESVRSRLIKNERRSFLSLLVSILYSNAAVEILSMKDKAINLLAQRWTGVSTKVLNDIFYSIIFEQVLESQTQSTDTSHLIGLYLQKASQLLNKQLDLSLDELEEFKLETNLTKNLSSTTKETDTVKPKKRQQVDIPAIEETQDVIIDHRVLIRNAGIVIIWPYLTRYFELLDMTEDKNFRTEAEAIRAVHLLQYLATGTTLAPEHELLLNKILCGLKIATPIPREVVLTEKEIEISDKMLKGVLQNWERLKSSSIEALREGFLIRDGYIIEKEKAWELKVEKKTLDILMENMPWGFGTIKLPWMQKRLNVEWL